ncbi:MAG: SBBP repeat-containing protein [Pirellulales bacterium]
MSRFDVDGILNWTRQLGTTVWDDSWGVSADGLGNVYVSGSTQGDLFGTSAGEEDAF